MKNRKAVEKRKQQKRAKRRQGRQERLEAFKAKQARRPSGLPEYLKGAKSLEPLSDEDYVFWLCHGANYLASDSNQGIWEPLFEGIYEGGSLPAPEEVAQTVLTRYKDALEAEDEFRGIPRAVLAWTVMDRQIVTVYKHEAVRRLQEKDPDGDAEALARSPHNPTVWDLMDQVKARTLSAGDTLDSESTT